MFISVSLINSPHPWEYYRNDQLKTITRNYSAISRILEWQPPDKTVEGQGWPLSSVPE